MTKKTLSIRIVDWLKQGSNIVSLLALTISSVFAGMTLYHDIFPPPQRARLTIFLEYPEFTSVSGSNTLEITLYIEVVNDSPMTATIRQWNLSLNFNERYTVTDQHDSHLGLILPPSGQTDFNMSRTVIGENNTLLQSSSLESIVVTMFYEDYVGMQQASREYGLIS